MVYQATSHDDISKSFRDLMAVEGTQSSEVIHVHDRPTTPIVVTTAVRKSAPDVESQEPSSTTMVDDNDNAGKGMGIAIFVLLIVRTVSAFFLPYISSACYIAALVLASVLTCGCCCAKNYNLKPHVKKMATATLVTLILLFIVSTILSVILVISFMNGYDETTGTFSDDTLYYDETTGTFVMDGYGYDETTGTFSDDTWYDEATGTFVMDGYGYNETTGTFSDDTWYDEATGTFSDNTSVNGTMILILSIIGYVLIGLALIFSGIFTWGRKCGAPHA